MGLTRAGTRAGRAAAGGPGGEESAGAGQAAFTDSGAARAHSMTSRWYSARCSTLSVPPDRSHRARISSLTSAADRSEEGSTLVDML